MIEEPEKTSSIKILNKGVDVAVVVAQGEVSEAVKASRMLAVRGVSTAVLEETCFHPMDKETLQYYEKRVQFFAGVGANITKLIRTYIKSETMLVMLKKNDAAYIVATIEAVRRSKFL